MSYEQRPLLSGRYDYEVDRKSQQLVRSSGINRSDEDPRLFSRWQSFSSVCMYVSVAGTTYAFAIYSKLLQDNLGYSTESCDLIASIGTTGLYLSLLAGLAIEKFGFKQVVYYGGVFIFVGFTYIFLAVTKTLPSNFYSVSFFYFLSQAGVCCHITTAVTVSVKLFPPESRGVAIGLSKGYFGLSTAVLSDIAGGYFDKIPSAFLMFIAVFVPIVGVVGASLANILPAHLVSFEYERAQGVSTSLDGHIMHWFSLFFVLLLLGYLQYAYVLGDVMTTVLAVLLLGVVFSIQLLPDWHGERILPIEDCVVTSSNYDPNRVRRDSFNTFKASRSQRRRSKLAALQRSKLQQQQRPTPHIDLRGYLSDSSVEGFRDSEDFDSDASSVTSDVESLLPPARLLQDSTSLRDNEDEEDAEALKNSSGGGGGNVSGGGGSSLIVVDHDELCFYGDSLSLPESIRTWRLWVLFFSFLVTCGSGLMVIYNVYAIAFSDGKSPSAFFVTLISLANGLGRVTAGLSCDHIIDHIQVSKLQLLCLIVLLMSFTQALLSIGSSVLIFPCFLAVGFLFGCNVSLTAVNVADLFGEKYIATNFGFIDTSPIFGSYIFATFSIDLFYQTNSVTDDGTEVCMGSGCFRYSFILNSLACLAAALSLYHMHTKTPR